MLALACIAVVPIIMWLSQSVLVRRAGLPLRWRISAADLPRNLKRINRVMTNVAFAVALIGFPFLRGQSPLGYYVGFFPLGAEVARLPYGAAAAILYLALLYLAWLLSGNVRFELRHAPTRLIKRLAGVPLTAILAALVEELLFRAILLADLMRSFDTTTAVVLGVLVFAGAHYVRSVKRYWTFPGHLALGVLFCVAFVVTGDLWLSTGLHAGGIIVLMGTRPFIRYTGPGWIVGASIFPYAGVVGVAALGLLTLNIWLSYGGTG